LQQYLLFIHIYDPEVEKSGPIKDAFPRRHVDQYDRV